MPELTLINVSIVGAVLWYAVGLARGFTALYVNRFVLAAVLGARLVQFAQAGVAPWVPFWRIFLGTFWNVLWSALFGPFQQWIVRVIVRRTK